MKSILAMIRSVAESVEPSGSYVPPAPAQQPPKADPDAQPGELVLTEPQLLKGLAAMGDIAKRLQPVQATHSTVVSCEEHILQMDFPRTNHQVALKLQQVGYNVLEAYEEVKRLVQNGTLQCTVYTVPVPPHTAAYWVLVPASWVPVLGSSVAPAVL